MSQENPSGAVRPHRCRCPAYIRAWHQPPGDIGKRFLNAALVSLPLSRGAVRRGPHGRCRGTWRRGRCPLGRFPGPDPKSVGGRWCACMRDLVRRLFCLEGNGLELVRLGGLLRGFTWARCLSWPMRRATWLVGAADPFTVVGAMVLAVVTAVPGSGPCRVEAFAGGPW